MIAAAALTLAACAEDKFEEFRTAAPERGAQYDYLNEYADLKTYVNRGAYPNFKLGGALAATDFNKQELDYALEVANFDEVVAGNEMKYSSCINDKGIQDFATVTTFVNNAVDAGLSVYGHTLVWHEQQGKYPASIIKGKEMEAPTGSVEKVVVDNDFTTATSYTAGWGSAAATDYMSFNGSLRLERSEAAANFWDVQYMVASGLTFEPKKEYKILVTMKGDHAGVMHFKMGDWGSGVLEGTFEFGTEKKEIEVGEFSVDDVKSGFFLLFQSGEFVGGYDIYEVKVVSKEAAESLIYINQVKNGDLEGDDLTNFVAKDNHGSTPAAATVVEGVGHNGSRCIKVHSIPDAVNDYDTQFWLYTPKHQWQEGEKYQVRMWVRADAAATASTQAHAEPGNYIHYAMLGDIKFTTEWKEVVVEGTVNASQAGSGEKTMHSIALNLNGNKTLETNFYFDDIQWNIVEKGNVVPYTDEEKEEILTNEMERWIKGMMQACEGKVKAWDLANETVSGGNPDGEGVYALQHGDESTTDKFYWQDYLGDLGFVRKAVKFARQYGPEDVKLFINDYNLESDWDNNGKLKSLIAWIKRWEADGQTHIDGIGSQMHISCYADPATQERKKQHIVKMLELMRDSKKLVRISELDMGFVDASGQSVMTADITEEQHLMMAELYRFVVSKYLEIIPAEQQWGVCQWCLTDSPNQEHAWRKGQPTGLWDQNYYRKHTYAGFADGLAGR